MKRVFILMIFILVFTQLSAKQKMDFMLFNLGSDETGRDNFLKMSTQFASAMAPMFLGEAESRGAEGFEVGIGYSFTKIDYNADFWRNALNDKPTDMSVPTFYNGIDVHGKKGFNFGLSIYGNVRYYILTEMISGGFGAEYSFNEGLKKWPDVSIGTGFNALFGASDLNMAMIELRLKISKTFVAKKEVKLVPFLNYSHLFTFASSNRLGGYFDMNDKQYASDSYAYDRKGSAFYFKQVFINIDRIGLGFKIIKGYFSYNVEAMLPFNALKAFSINTGFAVVF